MIMFPVLESTKCIDTVTIKQHITHNKTDSTLITLCTNDGWQGVHSPRQDMCSYGIFVST